MVMIIFFVILPRYPNLITSESLETLNSFLSAEDKSSKGLYIQVLIWSERNCSLVLLYLWLLC